MQFVRKEKSSLVGTKNMIHEYECYFIAVISFRNKNYK